MMPFLIGVVLAAGVTAGTPQPLGQGTLTSWVRRDERGPQAFGVSFDEAVLRGLPERDTEIVLPLPAVEGLPFRTAVVDWNTHGHPPAHIYDVPHFDFHFYTIDEATRMAIAGAPPGGSAAVPGDFIAPGFRTDGASVPMMGTHYAPMSAPEWHGGTFTATPVYGYTGGHLAFIESMVTVAYLQTHPALSLPLPMPQRFEQAGAYPAHATVRYDAANHRYDITFEDLQHAAGIAATTDHH